MLGIRFHNDEDGGGGGYSQKKVGQLGFANFYKTKINYFSKGNGTFDMEVNKAILHMWQIRIF